MKISIYNFKSIKKLLNFEIKPFTVLSGVNSSGKSSFVQLLLLLKQTVSLDSSKIHLDLEGDLYQVRDFKDILFSKNLENKLKVIFEFNKTEFNNRAVATVFDIFEGNYVYEIEIEFGFDKENKEFISEFVVKVLLSEGDKREQFIKFKTEKNGDYHYSIQTNHQTYTDFEWNRDQTISNIRFTSIYPTEYEILENNVTERKALKANEFKSIIDSFFNSISYIGPLREQPKDEYPSSRNPNYIGSKGEFVAQVLEKNIELKIQFNKFQENEDGINYETYEDSLLNAVNYWMCEKFKIAKNISVTKREDYYQIKLITDTGLETTIKHVGFGISQLLPIIVEGLRISANGILILEQPEIHLHPKYQSLLFDFLYGLTLQGKIVIVETHSDHLITRMRRRIAEDTTNTMSNNINLTFIESRKRENIFRTLDLDDYGVLDYFPEDFIEQSGNESRLIVKAQMKKRTKK